MVFQKALKQNRPKGRKGEEKWQGGGNIPEMVMGRVGEAVTINRA
jgi:hypothetical protein